MNVQVNMKVVQVNLGLARKFTPKEECLYSSPSTLAHYVSLKSDTTWARETMDALLVREATNQALPVTKMSCQCGVTGASFLHRQKRYNVLSSAQYS